jgi:hypothetical protein
MIIILTQQMANMHEPGTPDILNLAGFILGRADSSDNTLGPAPVSTDGSSITVSGVWCLRVSSQLSSNVYYNRNQMKK